MKKQFKKKSQNIYKKVYFSIKNHQKSVFFIFLGPKIHKKGLGYPKVYKNP